MTMPSHMLLRDQGSIVVVRIGSSIVSSLLTRHCFFWLSSVQIDAARLIWWALLKCCRCTKI